MAQSLVNKPILSFQSAIGAIAYMCSPHFRPNGDLQYEHMFPSTETHYRVPRLVVALRLIRSFLMLEDDYDVDWEVDQEERIEPPPAHERHTQTTTTKTDCVAHPHRMALQSRVGARRPGVPASPEQVCLCPLPWRDARQERSDLQRGSRTTTGSVRVAIDR